MDTAYISALSALAGSAIGGFASFATAWLTQHFQVRSQRAAAESSRREKLFGDFIEQTSQLFADATTHTMEDPSKLVPLYAVVSRMRLFATPATIKEAEQVMARIVDAYYAPNLDFAERHSLEEANLDPLRGFTEACRTELLR